MKPKTHPDQRKLLKRTAAVLLAIVFSACLAPGVVMADGLSGLEQLKANLAAANQQVKTATQNQDAAQATFNSARSALAAIEKTISQAEADAKSKQTTAQEKDAAVTTAAEAQDAAQTALDQNTAAVAAAQTNADSAAALAASAAQAASQAAAQTAAAQEALQTAQGNVDAAQADIDSESPDPGSNAGHEEWTAIGLFRYIVANTSESEAAHWDAQAAVDVLTSGTNTTGHSYKDYEGPVPDGANASAYQNIYQGVNASSRDDAVSLENFGRALDYIDEYNQYRAKENADEGYSLDTNVGMNCRLMAVAEVNLDTSKDSNVGHTRSYHVGENLSWGYSDPFDGWYIEEKAGFKNGATSGVGHYLNIVDYRPNGESSVNPTAGTGFAVHTAAPTYRVAHGQVFHTTSGYSQFIPTITYSTDEFRTQWFTPYYNAQVQAGMYGTTDEVKAEHQAALETAQQQLAEAQATYDDAVAQQQAAEEASDAAAAESAAAAEQLATEQGKTAGLEAALTEAQAAVTAAQAEATEAHAAYDEAAARVEQLRTSDEYVQAKANYKSAQQAVNDATAAVLAALNSRDAAERELSAYTDLSSNGNVSITFGTVVYNGQPQEPEPTVTIGDDVLRNGVDFTATYSENANAGTANFEITGKGDFRGTRAGTFVIERASMVAVTDKNSPYGPYEYTGAAIQPSVSLWLGEMELTPGVDYQIEYGENLNAGQGNISIRACGNFDGAYAIGFEITPKEALVKPNDATKVYGEADPELSAAVEGLLGDDAVEYTVARELGEDAGTYVISASGEEAQGNYKLAFEEGAFTITPAQVQMPAAAEGLVYNGEPQEGVTASERYDVSDGAATDAGDYTATATLKNPKNYCWADGSVEPAQVSWKIVPAKVQIPTGVAGLIYNGEEQVGVLAGEHFSVSDNSAAEVGEHIAKASLLDKKNYCWSDGSTDDKQIVWTIAGQPIGGATVSGIVAKKYTGAAQTQNISVSLDGVALVAGTDYTVSYKNNVKAGTATLIVEGAGNYGGTIERKFAIGKAENPLVVSAKAKSVKYKDVKKKAKAVSKAITVSKAQGAVTYAKVKKGSSKKLSINKTTGKITVKKGTKKGTYTIKVNVTAAGNVNYAKGTKAVTVKVKVK